MKCLICYDSSSLSSEVEVEICKAFCTLFSFSELNYLPDLLQSSFCSSCHGQLQRTSNLLNELNDIKESILNLLKINDDLKEELKNSEINTSLRKRISQELPLNSAIDDENNQIRSNSNDEIAVFVEDFDYNIYMPRLTLVIGDESAETEPTEPPPEECPSPIKIESSIEVIKSKEGILIEKFTKPSFVSLIKLEHMTRSNFIKHFEEKSTITKIEKKIIKFLKANSKNVLKSNPPKKPKLENPPITKIEKENNNGQIPNVNSDYSDFEWTLPKLPKERKKHIKIRGPSKLKYCPAENCKFQYRTLVLELPPHLKAVHPGEKVFKCQLCPKEFSCHQNFSSHRLEHKRGIVRVYCDKCPKSFHKKPALQKHILSFHSAKTEADFEDCKECGKRLAKGKIKWHLINHANKKKFICQICNKGFGFPSMLDKHQIKHTFDYSNGKKPFPCEICGDSFSIAGSLMAHKKWKHSEANELFCDLCEFKTKRKDALKSHKFRVHTPRSQWPLKCSWEGCEKMFVDKYDLNIHMRKHKGERIYKCEHCEKNFYSKAIYSDHLKLHKNETFICESCGKDFRNKRQLRTHVCKIGAKDKNDKKTKRPYKRHKIAGISNLKNDETKEEILETSIIDSDWINL